MGQSGHKLQKNSKASKYYYLNRSQNEIKNKFYSSLRKFIRDINKIFK